MDTEKRTLIAIVLAVVILLGYQYFFMPSVPQQPQQPVQKPETIQKTEIPAPPPPVAQPLKTIQQKEIRTVRIETDTYSAILRAQGATFSKFDLKTHKNAKGENISLLRSPLSIPPLSLNLDNNFVQPGAVFTAQGTDLTLKGGEKGSVSFVFISQDFSMKRTLTFYGDSYRVDITDDVKGPQSYSLTLGTDFGMNNPEDTSASHIGPVILKENDRIEDQHKGLSEQKTYREGIRWIAQEDKYFFAALVPATPAPEARVTKANDISVASLKFIQGTNSFIVYAGPKEYDRLASLGVGLEHIVDFGFFSILARPLFWVLKFFYSFLGNYGWAIVLLTIAVRIPFIPLLSKGQRSMKKLQELQPKIAEIREQHKKDPQKQQKEMMELYRKHKVNPMGGCFPILLQIPVFFALYKVLMVAFELRGAPFMLWITDLSEPDTLFGHLPAAIPLIGGYAFGPLPILMGVTMLIQQKMTPTTLDPTQNKIMMATSVFFTFIFLNFASGLVVYWLVNNILSIAQQYHTNRKLSPQTE